MMGEGRRRSGAGTRPSEPRPLHGQTPAPPIPLDPIDLLAGIAPGVELDAGEIPPGIDPTEPEGRRVTTTVGATGKLLRSGDSTIRRLIRTAVIRPAADADEPRVEGRDVEIERAGVPERTPDKPGE